MTTMFNEDVILRSIEQHYRDARNGVVAHYKDERPRLRMNHFGEGDKMVGEFGLNLPGLKRGELRVGIGRRPTDGEKPKYPLTDFEGYVVEIPYYGDRGILDMFLIEAVRDRRTTDVTYHLQKEPRIAQIYFRFPLEEKANTPEMDAFKDEMRTIVDSVLKRVVEYAKKFAPTVDQHDAALKEFTKGEVDKAQARENSISKVADDLGAMLRM